MAINEELFAQAVAASSAATAYGAAHDAGDGMHFAGTAAEYEESQRLHRIAQERYSAAFDAGAPPVSAEEALALVPQTDAARAYDAYCSEFNARWLAATYHGPSADTLALFA